MPSDAFTHARESRSCLSRTTSESMRTRLFPLQRQYGRPPARPWSPKAGGGGVPGGHSCETGAADGQTDRRARGKQRSGSFVRTPLQRRHCRRHARLSRTRREGKAAQNRGGPWGIALTRCLLAVPNARRTNLGANGSVGDTQRCAAACEQVRSPEHWDYGGRTVLPNGTRLPITYARTSTCTRVPP